LIVKQWRHVEDSSFDRRDGISCLRSTITDGDAHADASAIGYDAP
jgi:hypothetical protein